MATIEEDYVSFETAKLLKEKGFDVRCPMIYTADGEMLYTDVKHHNMYAVTNKQLEYYTDIIAPTLQMAMKWLREMHGLFVSIGNDDLDYNWQIFDIKNRTKDLDPTCLTESYAGYRKYELAAELAIKYCLEHLI